MRYVTVPETGTDKKEHPDGSEGIQTGRHHQRRQAAQPGGRSRHSAGGASLRRQRPAGARYTGRQLRRGGHGCHAHHPRHGRHPAGRGPGKGTGRGTGPVVRAGRFRQGLPLPQQVRVLFRGPHDSGPAQDPLRARRRLPPFLPVRQLRDPHEPDGRRLPTHHYDPHVAPLRFGARDGSRRAAEDDVQPPCRQSDAGFAAPL